jgi:hypothetical protein
MINLFIPDPANIPHSVPTADQWRCHAKVHYTVDLEFAAV